MASNSIADALAVRLGVHASVRKKKNDVHSKLFSEWFVASGVGIRRNSAQAVSNSIACLANR